MARRGPGVGHVGLAGRAMLARGNEGVAGRIKISEGAIGYVEYGFAKRLGLARPGSRTGPGDTWLRASAAARAPWPAT